MLTWFRELGHGRHRLASNGEAGQGGHCARPVGCAHTAPGTPFMQNDEVPSPERMHGGETVPALSLPACSCAAACCSTFSKEQWPQVSPASACPLPKQVQRQCDCPWALAHAQGSRLCCAQFFLGLSSHSPCHVVQPTKHIF